ncbi:hypothetical protein [Capnocytophaga canimorsus]|uniref:hypothetical protein n=1 Tax=Capnocytophaga canimorsus TaxID=28188 RepID=UPI001BB460BD|nr:hypothetical protein [Capnocytophaga canimorsus]
MKIRCFLFIIINLLLISCKSIPYNNVKISIPIDKNLYPNRKLKSTSTFYYNAIEKDGNIIMSRGLSITPLDDDLYNNTYTYDLKGNIIKRVKWDTLGNPELKEITFYNTQNKKYYKETYEYYGENSTKTQIDTIIYNNNGQIVSHIIQGKYEKQQTDYIYNQNNNKIQEKNYMDNALFYSKVFEYDKNNNLIHQKTEHHQKKELEEDLYFFYDNKNRLVKLEKRNDEGIIYEKNTYKYNAKGKVIKELTYNSDNKIIKSIIKEYHFNNQLKKQKYTLENNRKWIYTYDNGGKVMEVFEQNDNKMSKKFYSYNDFGKELKIEKFDQNKKRIELETFEYDSKGNMIKNTSVYNDNYNKVKTYQYDESGNCLQTKIYVNGQLTHIIEIELTYY